MIDKRLILLADDEPDIVSVYKKALEQAGFSVATASNGKEAIDSANKLRPDLVLMDVKMPVMDGVAATLELKENPATKNVKVVFLTAFSDPNAPEIDVQKAKEMGALDFIKKGLSLAEFIERVKSYL